LAVKTISRQARFCSFVVIKPLSHNHAISLLGSASVTCWSICRASTERPDLAAAIPFCSNKVFSVGCDDVTIDHPF
jgi:hypothetical protein